MLFMRDRDRTVNKEQKLTYRQTPYIKFTIDKY